MNDLSNMRLLCVACHSSATSPVAQSLPQWDPLASWTADRRFQDSPRPKQLTTPLNALDERQQMLLVDVKRCRRNICRNTAFEIPVVRCYDEFFRVTAETGVADFTWVEVPEPKTMAAFQRAIPFTGARFYHRSCVQWGVRHGKIQWSQLQSVANNLGSFALQ